MSVSGMGAQPSTSIPAVDLTLVNDVFEHYRGQRGALIPILQGAQAIYGYLPKEVLELIADRLGLSTSKVYGVATFYAQFYLERHGRHSLSCATVRPVTSRERPLCGLPSKRSLASVRGKRQPMAS